MSTVDTEHVLVVPTAEFHRLGHFQGFSSDVQRYLDPLLACPELAYRPRGQMERDPSFKQLIPYVLFCYTDEQDALRVFRYTRGSGQGESRLHAKRSIGIGGHIAREDACGASGRAAYEEGMRRELAEEVRIETAYEDRCIGMINDDQTDVGRVHLGVVHRFDVERPAVRSREDAIHDAQFVPLAKLQEERDRMETWSQICLDHLLSVS